MGSFPFLSPSISSPENALPCHLQKVALPPPIFGDGGGEEMGAAHKKRDKEVVEEARREGRLGFGSGGRFEYRNQMEIC